VGSSGESDTFYSNLYTVKNLNYTPFIECENSAVKGE